MSRPSSSGSGKSPVIPIPSTMATPIKPMSPVRNNSPASSIVIFGSQAQQRREFLQHLTNWSQDHDASVHFHGEISLLPQRARGGSRELELGQPVACILTDTSYPDARQTITIKLYPPQQHPKPSQEDWAFRRDSFHPTPSQPPTTKPDRYKLVIRSGSGWMSSRTYFSKLYFAHLPTTLQPHHALSFYLAKRSPQPPPAAKDTTTIRPLFHPFPLLPAELQDLILITAAGLTRHYNLRSNDYGPPVLTRQSELQTPISLSTLLRISKHLNAALTPYILHSTSFHFGLTGFTNFLWQAGPVNRACVRRITFHFGKLALLHCIRWFAPDPVFELFEPPVATNPRSLQFFWRAQIQDLLQDLRLRELAIDVTGVPVGDLGMVVACLRGAFGGVERVVFVDGGNRVVDGGLVGQGEGVRSWREMCGGYFERYMNRAYFFRVELLKEGGEGVGRIMDGDRGFFDVGFGDLGVKGGEDGEDG